MSCSTSQLADGPIVQYILQVTAPAGTPDPRGGSFTPPSSVKMVATLQQAAAAAGGNPDDPLPRRRKRVRARNSALGTILAPAKRSANSAVAVKRGDEGRITLANALVKPSTVVGTPDKRSPETRGATKVGLLLEIFGLAEGARMGRRKAVLTA